jgi:Flp pilus assembly pilin Flp
MLTLGITPPFFIRRSTMLNTLKRLISDERGLETVEYAVMTALIVAVLVTAIGALSAAVSTRFDDTKAIIEGIS